MNLTIEQALERGIKYCMDEGGEHLIEIQMVKNDPEYYKGRNLVLCEAEPRYYSETAEQIENVVAEYIDCNDEYFDDDGLSVSALEGCEDLFKQLAEKINYNMNKRPFYFNTEDRLIF